MEDAVQSVLWTDESRATSMEEKICIDILFDLINRIMYSL